MTEHSAADTTPATMPTMVTTPVELAMSTEELAQEFPDVHSQMIDALGRTMRRDGAMEFTVTALAKDAGVRLRVTREYLRIARMRGILHVLGRRTDTGRIRYCAYSTLLDAVEPA
jgi:hypothetical protein